MLQRRVWQGRLKIWYEMLENAYMRRYQWSIMLASYNKIQFMIFIFCSYSVLIMFTIPYLP